MNITRRLLVGTLTAVSLLAPAVARANTYTVEGCGTVGTGALGFAASPAVFGFADTQCNPSDTLDLEELTLEDSQTYDQGAVASWGVTAPAGESITGLGLSRSWSQSEEGWLAGWALNGEPEQSALPPGDDCLAYTSGTCNNNDVSGWFPIGGATSVQEELYCDAAAADAVVCPPAGGYSIVALAAVSDAVVQISDPGDAAPTASGTLWQAAQGSGLTHGWLSGLVAGSSLTMSFAATDPGGICTLDATLTDASGDVVANSEPVAQTPVTDPGSVVAADDGLAAPFVATLPCGGSSAGSTTFAPNLASLPSGTYYLNVASQNPGEYQAGTYTYATGNSPGQGYALRIDNSTPSITLTPTAQAQSSQWLASPETVTVTASDAGASSGLSQIVCSTPSGVQTFPVSGDSATVNVTLSQPGADSLSCEATSVAGNSSPPASTSFDVDAQTPTVSFGGAPPAPAWNSGAESVTAIGSESDSASGVASVTCQVDGGSWATTQGTVAHLQLSGDGSHSVDCYATTAAGVVGATADESVQIDSQPPELSFVNGPAVGVWSTRSETISARAAAVGGASITSISCELNGVPMSFANSAGEASESVVITVPPPGGELSCEAIDSAGNRSPAASSSFLIDATPPSGYFLASDPAEPARVQVRLTDSGSGVAGAAIEVDVDGEWRALHTRFDAATGIASAEVPDGGSLPDGTYLLRARAWDRAGNVAVIEQTTAGGAESVTLPLRQPTVLTASVRAGDTRVLANASSSGRRLILSYGERATVTGELKDAHGVAVVGAEIVVAQQILGEAKVEVVGRTSTGRRGQFSYTMAPGASRTVLFTYDGSAVLRSASAEAGVSVGGRITLRVPPDARPGERVTLLGSVAGGHIPTSGLLVQLWYQADGRGGWQPFERPVRASRDGAWSLRFRVGEAAAGHHYAFKAVASGQSGWPYRQATSPPANLQVS